MPITIQNSAGGGVTLDSTTSSNETLQLPSGGGTLAPLASPVFTGNVGIGVTPETWGTNGDYTGLQVGTGLSLYGRGAGDEDRVGMMGNAYHDATNDRYEYIGTGHATHYAHSDGQHVFQVAPSGSADSAISWATRMTIANNEEIHFYRTSDSGSTQGISVLNGRIQMSRPSGVTLGFYNSGASGAYVGNIEIDASSTSYNTSSDYRLKEDDVPMTGATERVKALRPINFAWKVDGSRVDGFFAHELAEVVPEAATGTKDAMMDEEYEVTPAVLDDEGNETTAAVMGTRSVPDMQGIDQSKLVPLLTATIQELIARIEALENV